MSVLAQEVAIGAVESRRCEFCTEIRLLRSRVIEPSTTRMRLAGARTGRETSS